MFAVSLLSFVVWFATIEKAKVPPPAGKGMNHKGGVAHYLRLKKQKQKSGTLRRRVCSHLGSLSALSFLIPRPIFEIPVNKFSLDLVLPTALKTLSIHSFIRGAQPSAIWCRNYFKLFIIFVILNL